MRSRALAILLLWLAPVFPVYAAAVFGPSHYDVGRSFFDLGKYDDAIAEFEKAYAETNDPALLFDLAQAHRWAGHREEALYFCRQYLDRDPASPNRPKVERWKADLENPLPPPPPPPPPTRPSSSSDRVTTAVVVGSVGGAFVVGGIISGLVAKSASDKVDTAATNHTPFDPSVQKTGQHAETIEWIGLGVGAAAVATGLVLYLTAPSRMENPAPPSPGLAIAPLVAPGSGGASLRMTF